MKKISIILSAALLAATFALAGCSNVSELNGTEWDVYSAGASGKTAAQVQADNAAEAAKLQLTVDKGSLLKEDFKAKYATSESLKNDYTFTLATKASADVAAATYTLTITGTNVSVTYKNVAIAKDAETVKFVRTTGETGLILATGALSGAIN